MWFSCHHSLVASKRKWHISAHSLLVRRNHMTSPQVQGSLGNAEDHMGYLMGSTSSSIYTDGRKNFLATKAVTVGHEPCRRQYRKASAWRLWFETWRFLILYSRHAWAIQPPQQSVEWMELYSQVGESTWFKCPAPCQAQPTFLVTLLTFPCNFHSFYK